METPHISSHALQSFPIDAQVLYKAIVNSTEDYVYIVDMAAYSSDETYRFVTRRENELLLAQFAPLAEEIIKSAEA